MPILKPFQAVVLCEDEEHYQFVRGFLLEKGVCDRKIRLHAPFPDGVCSAEQYVRKYFPEALQKVRRNTDNIFLVVAMDVDKQDKDVSERKRQLDKALEDAKMDGIKDGDDRLVLLLPKRNVETWFAWLDSEPSKRKEIDETHDYKTGSHPFKPKLYGKKMALLEKSCSTSFPDGSSPLIGSLSAACESYRTFCQTCGRIKK